MLLIEFQGNENFCRMGKILMKERRKKMKQSIDMFMDVLTFGP